MIQEIAGSAIRYTATYASIRVRIIMIATKHAPNANSMDTNYSDPYKTVD